jgi:hypothetical protein
MKQTAVQYFASKVMYLNISPKEMHDFLDWFEQAKEMEEGQIALAYSTGALEGVNENFTNGYTYYKKTYK